MSAKRENNQIAIIGFACKFPDADNPDEFWENILSRRRSFRRIPEKRLSRDYFTDDYSDYDRIYANQAALLKNYSFDRSKFKISNSSFRAADLTHWLALDVASEAIAKSNIHNIDKDRVGVIIGNTLTGELSRANVLRLRWPYVAKKVLNQLTKLRWSEVEMINFLNELELNFKSPFQKMEEDSLAGGLSNTIAGRICNYYNYKGGGYTIDGACSSSLLAVANGCNSIAAGDLQIAVVGGVDISIDPFELVGFARAGALAKGEMLVYDQNSNGFWPGEGCGFVVLADLDFAVKNRLNVQAIIRGWGISSDGSGGLTRPEVFGQSLAIRRAYEKAGYGFNDVKYVEGHGTGTSVGDLTELSAISASVREPFSSEIFIGSVKANIGHTKAAAGMAALIKSVLILQNRLIPPSTGLRTKHQFLEQNNHIKLSPDGEHYSGDLPFRVGVSAMGFGGINTHITLEEARINNDVSNRRQNERLLNSYQDAELFLLGADTKEDLCRNLESLKNIIESASCADLTDISYALFRQLDTKKTWRLAIEASTISELEIRIGVSVHKIMDGLPEFLSYKSHIYYTSVRKQTRIGFLFPGQGNGSFDINSSIFNRFTYLRDDQLKRYLPEKSVSSSSTDKAQPAIVASSIFGISILNDLNVKADICVGHSLGELTALHYAGGISKAEVLDLASRRGYIMHQSPNIKGRMLSVRLPDENFNLTDLCDLYGVSVACVNSPRQVVVSGIGDNVLNFKAHLDKKHIVNSLLTVENAFHSTLMSDVENSFKSFISEIEFSDRIGAVYSTVTGELLDATEIDRNLCDQLTKPVLFSQAAKNASSFVDYWIEVGVGRTLTGLVNEITDKIAIPLDLGSGSIKGLLNAAGLVFATGAEITLTNLLKDRFHRHFSLSNEDKFIENPCETEDGRARSKSDSAETIEDSTKNYSQATELLSQNSIFPEFRMMLANKLGLPEKSLSYENRMLDDLHLNSLTVGQLIAEFASLKGLRMTQVPTEYSNSKIQEIVDMLEKLNDQNHCEDENGDLQGVGPWVHSFVVEKEETISDVIQSRNGIQELIEWQFIGAEPINALDESIRLTKSSENLLITAFDLSMDAILMLLKDALLILQNQSFKRVFVIQNEDYLTGFMKSFYLENPSTTLRVINVPRGQLTNSLLYTELIAKGNFRHIHVDQFGKKRIGRLKPIFFDSAKEIFSIKSGDHIIVTGGGKGITFECGKELAIRYGAVLIIIGRSDREQDNQLATNLLILDKLNIKYIYYQFDIADEGLAGSHLAEIARIYEIKGIIHGAGKNNPIAFSKLGFDNVADTMRPKVNGLVNLGKILQTTNPAFFITFGSIISRTGLDGNADYACANELVRNEMEKLAGRFKKTFFRNIEWSVWSGAGMGENLGVLESLIHKGIQPIGLDDGVKYFSNAFNKECSQVSVIVSGRFGDIPTLGHCQSEGKMLRFIDDIRIHYPSIEMISDTKLSMNTDLYLMDHQLDNQVLWPAVLGMEAMAQMVFSLYSEEIHNVQFRNLELLHPIVVPISGSLQIRIVGQRVDRNTFTVAIRTEETEFVQDYFKATVLINTLLNGNRHKFQEGELENAANIVTELYTNILFHKGRFQKLRSYLKLTPYTCIALAEQESPDHTHFNDYAASTLLLGNFTLRDSALHAVQACVPDMLLIPIGTGSIDIYNVALGGRITIQATEIKRVSDIYHFNIYVYDSKGLLSEQWTDARFKAYRPSNPPSISLRLLKNILQRRVDDFYGRKDVVELRSNAAFWYENIYKRFDGRPFSNNIEYRVSNSNLGEINLYLMARANVGCDIEAIRYLDDREWRKLLGMNDFNLASVLSKMTGEAISIACTRVWGVKECSRKSTGIMPPMIRIGNFEEKNNIVIFNVNGDIVISMKCFLFESNCEMVISLQLSNVDELL
jgi:enediyne polyketide synthase